MKVGVLTFDRALNYGAVLQAFALQTCLTRLGVECEVIDYRCEALERNYKVFSMTRRGLKGAASAVVYLPTRLSRYLRFRMFRRDRIRSSSRRYTRADIATSTGTYDYFIVGSDQVWNPDLTGGDHTYFLDFCSEPTKRISYAASLGRSRSFAANAEIYRAHLADFRALSVREQDGSDYLSSLLDRDVEWVMDPVFLLSATVWAAVSKAPPVQRPYIFAYCLHETDLYRYVERLRQLTGFEVVYVPESIKTRIRGKRLPSPAVEALVGCVQHAQFVVTDSFHVLALSIIFRRDFKVQLKRRLPELNSRITSLLAATGLEGQVLREEDYKGDAIPNVAYEGTSDLLDERVRLSLQYLRTSLGLQEVS